MKNQFVIFLVFISMGLFSCNSERIKTLEEENNSLKVKLENANNTIKSLNSQISEMKRISEMNKTYAFCVITIYTPSGQTGYNEYIDWKEKKIVSDIKTFMNFNSDLENQFIDSFEEDYFSYSNPTTFPVKIRKRDCYKFTSYSEASTQRRKYKDQ